MTVVDGDLYVGGLFNSVGGIPARNIAGWDGTQWFSLGEGVNGTVYSIIEAGNKLYVGGSFTEAGGIVALNVACWDGKNWEPVGEGLDNVVFAMSYDGTNIFAGGHFTMSGAIHVSKVAKWNGADWEALGLGILPVNEGGVLVGAVDSMTVSGNSLYVGGRFRNAGGIVATNVARWDGANWNAMGEGLRFFNGPGSENGVVRALLMRDGVLYAGGGFRLAGNVNATNIARWSDGEWNAFGDANAAVWSLRPHGRGFFAGGSFRTIGGISARNVAYWDGTIWASLGSGILGGSISGGLISSGSELFVGGTFTTAGNTPSTNIALWHIPHSLSISRTGDQVQLCWPATGTNFLLEAKGDFNDTDWVEVSQPPAVLNEECIVTELMNATNRFYRLRRKP